jgi:2-amino-4-hydroxy-6-hydroxymethyldihydropteridine diphosphokinase
VILIAIGSNQPGSFASPQILCEAAVEAMEREGLHVTARSGWYSSAPVPPDSAQPWYVNGAVAVATSLEPQALLSLLNRIEAEFGRVRGAKNGPRTLDLDLIAHGCRLIDSPSLTVPHPRMHERAFVLLPLLDIAPNWRHPQTGEQITEMLDSLQESQVVLPITR